MSNAAPMEPDRRAANYHRQQYGDSWRWPRFTGPQQRRWNKKQAAYSQWERIYEEGRPVEEDPKGRPTPRRPRRG